MAQLLISEGKILTRVEIKASSCFLLHLLLLFRDSVDFLLGIITLSFHVNFNSDCLYWAKAAYAHFKIRGYLNKTIWRSPPSSSV